jgi:hypothetical protein
LSIALQLAGLPPGFVSWVVVDDPDRATLWSMQDDEIAGWVADGRAVALRQLNLHAPSVASDCVVCLCRCSHEFRSKI